MKKVAWKKVSHFEGPEHSPGFLLWQVSTQWRRQIESALATLDLTHPQFVLLASIGWLTRNNDDITQIELARHCGTDINMTSQVLRLLERKGYIERHKSKDDERSKYPQLTDSGAALVERAIPVVEEVDRKFFERLNIDEPRFIKILQRLIIVSE